MGATRARSCMVMRPAFFMYSLGLRDSGLSVREVFLGRVCCPVQCAPSWRRDGGWDMIRSGKASLDDLAAVLLITWKLNLSNTTGLHFNLPCVETHEIVDMRTITLGVPPQEVHTLSTLALLPLPPPLLQFICRFRYRRRPELWPTFGASSSTAPALPLPCPALPSLTDATCRSSI